MWSWEGWTALSVIAQFLMVFASFVSIIITMYQLRKEKREYIDIKFDVKEYLINRKNECGNYISIGIIVSNHGSNPIYVKEYGISLSEAVDSLYRVSFLDNIRVNPGEEIRIGNKKFKNLFINKNQKISDTCNPNIYILTGRGNKIELKTNYSYKYIADKINVCTYEK